MVARSNFDERAASGEAGLISSEGAEIDRPASSNDPDIPRFRGSAPQRMEKDHPFGVPTPRKIGSQIWHMGTVQPPDEP
jgi:hypothetical protein